VVRMLDDFSVFDSLQLPIGAHDFGGVGLCWCEAGGQHITTRQKLLIGLGFFVVVVEKTTWSDLEVEQSPDPPGAEDSLGGYPDLGRVFEPSRADAVFQRQQLRFGSGDHLGSALCVPTDTSVGLDHHCAGPVFEGDISGSAAVFGYFNPHSVLVNSRQGLGSDRVSAESGGRSQARVWRVVWCFTWSGGIREEGVSTTFGV